MLEFLAPTIKDKQWARPIFLESGYISSDNAFGTAFIWKDVYNLKICKYNDFLLRLYEGPQTFYGFPLGVGNLKEVIEILIDDAKKRNISFCFTGITSSMISILNEIMPEKFIFNETRNTADYIYESKDLISLKGKKYHSKRNHISKFNNMFDFVYYNITDENIGDCKIILKKWYDENDYKNNESLCKEKKALELALEYFNELELVGGVIAVNNAPVAFTIGEKINDEVFVIHFEKALKEYMTAYSIINNEFAKNNLCKYKYINREEDLGLEGLRKAKLSYHPKILLKKYDAFLR